MVALYYYARINRTMYSGEREQGDPVLSVDIHNSVLVGALMLGTVVFAVCWALALLEFARRSRGQRLTSPGAACKQFV